MSEKSRPKRADGTNAQPCVKLQDMCCSSKTSRQNYFLKWMCQLSGRKPVNGTRCGRRCSYKAQSKETSRCRRIARLPEVLGMKFLMGCVQFPGVSAVLMALQLSKGMLMMAKWLQSVRGCWRPSGPTGHPQDLVSLLQQGDLCSEKCAPFSKESM